MSRYLLIIFLSFISGVYSFGQQAIRKLPYNINQPSLNISHPFVSGDGNTMLYLTDYTEDGSLTMFWTQKKGTLWQDGKELTRLVNRPDQNLQGAYSLNYDGTMMIITSRKSGLGGFELWYSERSNGDWSPVKNFGAPVNSSANEGAAVLTTDDKGMYFMRCDKMNEQRAEGCELYFTEKKYGRWQEPQRLPDNINKYKPQMPRIMADGETLIFSSKAAGGEGGFDLYVTKKNESGWSDPENLVFANTPQDDQFVSAAAKGRYLYKAQPGQRKMEIVQLLFPDELKPKGVYRVNGKITDSNGDPVMADLKIFDTEKRSRLINEATGKDGSFSFVLVEGKSYDVSLEPKNSQLQYFSKIYDMQEVPSRDRETLEIVTEPYQINVPVINENLFFKQHMAEVDDRALFEVQRLASVLRANEELGIKIKSILYNYQEDSVASDPDLTEVRMDTLLLPVEMLVPSRLITTEVTDTLRLDTLESNGAYIPGETDTLIVMIDVDSVHLQTRMEGVSVSKYKTVIRKTYHNDRTLEEAEAIKSLLIEYGVDPERIKIEGEAVEDNKENKFRAVEITYLPLL